MFFTDIHARDFIELLEALPSSPATTRAHIHDRFGVLVTGDDPVGWWNALTFDRGEEGAANAVAQLVISTGGKRVLALIRADAAGRSITPRADDSKLVRLIFDEAVEDVLYDQWGVRYGVSEYYKETQAVLEDDDPDLPEPEDAYDLNDLEGDEEETENGPSLFDLFSGKPRPSAQRGAKWTLERLQTPSRGFLTVPGRNGKRRTWRTSCGPTGRLWTSASTGPSTSSGSSSA